MVLLILVLTPSDPFAKDAPTSRSLSFSFTHHLLYSTLPLQSLCNKNLPSISGSKLHLHQPRQAIMSSTTSKPSSDPASPSTSAVLQSLERRMSTLSIRVATDRADAREKLPLVPGTWVRDSVYTQQLDEFQIKMEKTWIGLRDASVKKKEVYVGMLEDGYEKMITAWKAEGKV